MSNPFVIGLQAPTEEQMKVASEHWMKPLRPCLYTHWPERFKELSFATYVEELTRDETAELAGYFDRPDHPWAPKLQAKISRGVGQFSSGCFFRLESRSPKDNYWGEMTNYRACFFSDIKRLLYSERILDDLVLYSSLESEPLRLLFREWHPIPKAEEFRCFIRARELVGISQYHYVGFDESRHQAAPLAFASVFGRSAELQRRLTEFVNREIVPHLHVDDLVVDLWADHLERITLIEINPYGLSDPCLLSYPELEGNGFPLFRVVETQSPSEAA